MIADFLFKGKEHARTGQELAAALGCSVRDISAKVEKERRQGQPIIASCDPEQPGYFLAETAEELQQYCNRLHHRAGEIHKTRRALLEAANDLPAEQEGNNNGNESNY